MWESCCFLQFGVSVFVNKLAEVTLPKFGVEAIEENSCSEISHAKIYAFHPEFHGQVFFVFFSGGLHGGF